MGKTVDRRTFVKESALVLGGVAVSNFGSIGIAAAAGKDKARVYFTQDINGDGLLKLYSQINKGMTGKVAIKLHTGARCILDITIRYCAGRRTDNNCCGIVGTW